MIKNIVQCILLVFIGFVCYFFFGYISNAVGWYGYKKNQNRRASINQEESIARGVFIKSLKYRIVGTPYRLKSFDVFLEKGFKYGSRSAKETLPLIGSNFPYQLRFIKQPAPNITIAVAENELNKFDSSSISGGYLRLPHLTDTIRLLILSKGVIGEIKVWE